MDITPYLEVLGEVTLVLYAVVITVILAFLMIYKLCTKEKSEKNFSAPVIKYLQRILFNRAAIFMIIGIFFLSLFSFGPFSKLEPWSTIVVTLSSTLIAAATLSIIILDSDYRNFLKDFVVSILFEPEKYKNRKDLLRVWEKVTLKLLSNTLPFQNEKAVEMISKKLIEDKKDYHFENIDTTYHFIVKNNKLEITQIVNAILVISPNVPEPVLSHSVKLRVGSNCVPEENDVPDVVLTLNNQLVVIPDDIPPVEDDEGKLYKFKYDLKPYLNDPKIKYERVRKTVQNITEDPYIAANFSRYVKGCQIQTFVTEGYKVLFDRLGPNSTVKVNHHPITLSNNIVDLNSKGDRRVLCDPHDLLLPGEGYILTIVESK